MNIYDDIRAERQRQIDKWGTDRQGPDHTPGSARLFGDFAKALCQYKFHVGKGSYCDILIEEVAEATDEAAAGNTEALRTELIQVAAVCVAWISLLDKEKA